MSAVSRPGFFRSGVTIACFCESGNRPCIRDALTIRVTNGSSTSMNSRNRKVGTGSNAHDLTGDDIAILRTSTCEHDRKDVNDDVALSMVGGGDRPAVSERTLSIFLAKKAANPSSSTYLPVFKLKLKTELYSRSYAVPDWHSFDAVRLQLLSRDLEN